MTEPKQDFWEDVLSESADEHGASLTGEQIKLVAKDIAMAAENMDMVFPAPSGPSPVEVELRETREALTREREKVTCRQCNGTGQERCDGPSHYSISNCWKCRGEGRHLP